MLGPWTTLLDNLMDGYGTRPQGSPQVLGTPPTKSKRPDAAFGLAQIGLSFFFNPHQAFNGITDEKSG
jgi:hypothetical protein